MLISFRFFKKALNKASLASLCFLVVVAACSPSDRPRVYRLDGRTMGTTYHITAVVGPSVALAENALQMRVDKALENVNQIMSTYIADSELSMLNKIPVNQAIIVSQALFDILLLSSKISEQSGGAFDVTVGPLVNLWGFGPDKSVNKKPELVAIEDAKARVGYQQVLLDREKRQIVKQANVTIDLSAIAKGYGADVIAKLFSQVGIGDYMIEVGGEIAVAGNNPAGTPWRIGVEQPTLAQTGVMEAVSTPMGGIATSGDYRNYFEVDGKRFSHTIDPKTGYPIEHHLASVTVVAPSAAEADAWATAINVLGPDAGYKLAVEKSLAVYLIIRHEGSFVTKSSPAFNQYRVEL